MDRKLAPILKGVLIGGAALIGLATCTLVAIPVGMMVMGAIHPGRTIPYVEAVELSLQSDADREELAAILRRQAQREGMFFRDDSTWMMETSKGDHTVSMVLYRPLGGKKEWPEVQVSNLWHVTTPWITFLEAADPQHANASQRTRDALMSELRQRWPDLRELPLLPSGGLPSWRHLRITAAGYKVAAEAATTYGLPPSSSLLAPAGTPTPPTATGDGKRIYCLHDPSLGDLASASLERLRELRKHYSICTFDPHSTDLLLAELVRRQDGPSLFDAAIRAGLKNDRETARDLMRLSAKRGYVRAQDGVAAMERGEAP